MNVYGVMCDPRGGGGLIKGSGNSILINCNNLYNYNILSFPCVLIPATVAIIMAFQWLSTRTNIEVNKSFTNYFNCNCFHYINHSHRIALKKLLFVIQDLY